jgi:ethanolamine utilization protein EutA (predicted chaperonin)
MIKLKKNLKLKYLSKQKKKTIKRISMSIKKERKLRKVKLKKINKKLS